MYAIFHEGDAEEENNAVTSSFIEISTDQLGNKEVVKGEGEPPPPFTSTYSRGRIQRKTWCMGPSAGADYNLTFCPLQSRLQHIYHGQSHTRVDLKEDTQSIFSREVKNFNCIVYSSEAQVQKFISTGRNKSVIVERQIFS